MGRRVVEKRRIASIRDGDRGDRFDALAVEEPMEIRVNGDPVAVTMRTPGDDFELALGFCIAEQLVTDPRTVVAIRYCAGTDPETGLNTYNVVDVQLRDPTPVAAHLRRQVYVSSSCGICGTASIDAVRKAVAGVADDACTVDLDVLQSLPQRLRAAQKTFERTGGLHAAAVFEPAGDLLCLREDVGRHNAVDKVVGWAATQDRLPLSGRVLMVSGRVAFEIAQKALLARIPFVAAVSAPSSLAVSLAEEAGMTLVGFLRGTSMNVYAGAHRITA